MNGFREVQINEPILRRYSFDIKLEKCRKGLSALKHKILSPDEFDIRLTLESEPLEENLVTKIFHKGEIYSGKEIISKLKSIKGFEVGAKNTIYNGLDDVDKNKKYEVIDELSYHNVVL